LIAQPFDPGSVGMPGQLGSLHLPRSTARRLVRDIRLIVDVARVANDLGRMAKATVWAKHLHYSQ
jgi:hypothetical protein